MQVQRVFSIRQYRTYKHSDYIRKNLESEKPGRRPEITKQIPSSLENSKLNPSSSHPSPEKMSTPPTFTHYAQAQQTFQPPLIAHTNHFLGDVSSSQPNDPVAPISAGFYRLEAGKPLVYEYTYHEMKIIVDGEFDVSDGTGQTVHATRGDVFYFPKGSVITFSTPTFGLGFFCGQRKEGGG